MTYENRDSAVGGQLRSLVAELGAVLQELEILEVPREWVDCSVPSSGGQFSCGGAETWAPAWPELKAAAEHCQRCRLAQTRNKVVFGVGKTDSPLICFVGEGPGADEDKQGEPFVGKAGVLLTAAITKGLGLKREDVYICNVVKCRPPENRTPLPDEVAACTPYLYRQLELLRPKVIVTLGQPAQLALSGVQQGITKLRGQWLSWRGIRLMPTFHPAYLLRNPPAKADFWRDLQEVMRELGLPLLKQG